MSDGKYLVVVESPAKAKTISRFLGPDYQVEASYGHLRDLPQNAKEIPAAIRGQDWARMGVNVEDGFAPVYVVPTDKKKHVKRLKDALKNADSLLLATDEDREGEAISWHVLQLLKPKKTQTVQRIVFHEVTPEAIAEALASPRVVDENLVRAQEARRIVDRLYGYSLSPLLWKRVAPGLSAGRVQSVAVRVLVERERDRIQFVSAEFWDLKAEVEAEGGRFKVRLQRVGEQRIADSKCFDPETGQLTNKKRLLLDSAMATKLATTAAETRPWTVTSLERNPGNQKPAAPFITSTLQQEGNRKLRMTSKRTMQVAQRLYEGIDLSGERVGLITYMRTDSVTLAERALTEAREVIADIYGENYLPPEPLRYKTKAKRAQEAHEAIRPTDLARRPQDVKSFLDEDEYRLYELIWKRTIACQMLPARFERTAVEVSVEVDGKALAFTASGRRIVFPGFLRAYVEGSDDPEALLGDQEMLLPELTKGGSLEPTEVTADGRATKPPYRYTEASLVSKLEEKGIGRPSTYASIISTIQDRDYAFKKGNELIPTFTAFCVTDLLEKQFEDLVDTEFTARMEDNLDDIAAGKVAWDQLVSGFYSGDEEELGLNRRVSESEQIYPAITIGIDPDSGEEVQVKVGKYGAYVRRGEGGGKNAATIPEGMAPDELTIDVAVDILHSKNKEDLPLTADPVTGRNVTLKKGRFGDYLELELTDEEKEVNEAAKTAKQKVKPRRTSLPQELKPADITPEIAARLIQLPRTLGKHPESGVEITTALGRYGPYVKHESDFRNITSWERACDITLEEALAVLKEPKKAGRQRGAPKVVLKDLGKIEGIEAEVKVLDGRYGPYVTDGKLNATIPKGSDPQAVTPEQAVELLKVAAEKKKSKPTRRRKK